HRHHARGADHRPGGRLAGGELVLVEAGDPALLRGLAERRRHAIDEEALLTEHEVNGPELTGSRLRDGLLGGHALPIPRPAPRSGSGRSTRPARPRYSRANPSG